MTIKLTATLLATCLLTGACLENEETLEVRRDGSVSVTLRAKGDLADLTGGHALPLHAPWQPADSFTRTWVEAFGPSTGGAAMRERLAGGAQRELGLPEHQDAGDEDAIELRAQAHFSRVEDLPAFFAPAGEPYRTAMLERATTLSITPKGARRVYVFERTYSARPFSNRFDKDRIPEDILAALEQHRRLDDEQLLRFTELAREWAHTPASTQLVTSALGAVYTDGDGKLSAAAFERAVERLHTSIDTVLSVENIGAFFDALTTAQQTGTPIPAALDLEQQLRAAARVVLTSTLEDEGVRHAVLERLEWNFTSYDLAQDISDESFRLNVSLPGTIVDGNFDELSGNTASWSFDGKQLRGADRVLRVVSVLE